MSDLRGGDRRKSVTDPADWLRPAFGSTAQAVSFVLLLAVMLAMPAIITKTELIDRRHSYEIIPENQGGHSFVLDEIFNDDEDIDILFLGSSFLFAAVDTPKVQQALSEAIGRPAKVVTFGHYFNSIDILYMQMRDLLEHKRARLVVLAIPRIPEFSKGPSTTSFRFMRYSEVEEIFDEVPLEYKASIYAGSVFRSPRDLLTIVRNNHVRRSKFAENLGADKAELGWGRDVRTFERFTPLPPAFESANLIYSAENRNRFHFSNDEIPYYQNLYLEKLIELLEHSHTPFMLINIPHFGERHSFQAIERHDWAARFGTDVPLVGVPPSELFAGFDDKQIEKLYFDNEHLNINGNEYYTQAVLPGILEIYKRNASKVF